MRSIEKATRQPITEMALPSVADVNTRRVAKFADSITAQLGSSADVALYRGLVEDYAREHDVPLADIAAALAVMTQDGRSLLLEADPAPVARVKREPPTRDSADRKRPKRDEAEPRSATRSRSAPVPMAVYRLSVGRRQKVNPSQIVGALANEGRLRREDFGAIDVKIDHSLVELPAKLSKDVFSKLARTRISGQLIELRRDPDAVVGKVKPRKRAAKPHHKG